MTERTITDFSEHIFRSVRSWLHVLYPSPNIFISRKQATAATERPAFRLEMASGPDISQAASGFVWADYLVGITYAAESQMDAHRVVGRIATAAAPPSGRIPLKLYSWPWPNQPHVAIAANAGGTLPTSLDLALVGEDPDGNLSAPSERLTIPMPTPDDTLAVTLRGWQDIRKVRLYAAAEGEPLKLQAVGLDGDVLTMAALFAGASLEASPVLPYAGIRVQSISSTVMELSGTEETYDGAVSMALRVLVPWAWVADVELT